MDRQKSTDDPARRVRLTAVAIEVVARVSETPPLARSRTFAWCTVPKVEVDTSDDYQPGLDEIIAFANAGR